MVWSMKTTTAERLFRVFDALVHEVTLRFGDKGLRVRELEPTRIAMYEIHAPLDAFTETGDPFVARVEMCDLYRAIKSLKKYDRITFDVDGARLVVQGDSGGSVRTFRLPLSEDDIGELPTPKGDYKVRAVVSGKDLYTALEDCQLYNGYARISTAEGGDAVEISATGAKGECICKLRGAELEIKEPASAEYPIEYVLDIIRPVRRGGQVVICWASGAPLQAEYVVDGVSAKGYVAPRGT